MARVYATPEEYAAWLLPDVDDPEPPAGATRALRAASGRVDELLLTAVYPTDDAGMPTEPAHVTALMEATCAQADYQRGIGDPFSTGAAAAWSSVKLGSASMSRGSGGRGGAEQPSVYSSQAAAILQQAGLVPEGPWVY